MKNVSWVLAFIALNSVGALQAQAAVRPDRAIVLPTGVGRCIFDAIPNKIKQDVLATYLGHHDITKVPGFRDAVRLAAKKCTGRDNADKDGAIVGLTLSVFWRFGAGYELDKSVNLGQGALDDAWATANPEQRRPFDVVAKSYLDPGPIAQVDAVAAVAPFVQSLRIITTPSNQNDISRSLWIYYMATALRDQAEARLSAGGEPSPK
jgi:hypothetical protein